jgi:hypothetical protein
MVRYEQFGAHDDGGRIQFDLYVPGPDEYRADLGGPAQIAAIEAYGTFQEPLTGQAWDLTRTVRLEPAPFEGGPCSGPSPIRSPRGSTSTSIGFRSTRATATPSTSGLSTTRAPATASENWKTQGSSWAAADRRTTS